MEEISYYESPIDYINRKSSNKKRRIKVYINDNLNASKEEKKVERVKSNNNIDIHYANFAFNNYQSTREIV